MELRVRWLVSLRTRAKHPGSYDLAKVVGTFGALFHNLKHSIVDARYYILTVGHRAFPDPELTKDIIFSEEPSE